jgi:hypothetical protein
MVVAAVGGALAPVAPPLPSPLTRMACVFVERQLSMSILNKNHV